MNHLGDTNKMVGDTPRMDASAHDDGAIWQTGCDIERELNAANTIIRQQQLLDEENLRLKERIKRLEEELERTKQDRNAIAKKTREPLLLKLDHAAERIKRLEAAGDVLCAAAAFMGWHMEIENWRKAKEAKP